MIAVMHTWEIIPGKNQEALSSAKKAYDHEKETFGQEVTLMIAATGKRNKVVVLAFFESQAVREEHQKKLQDNPERQASMKEVRKYVDMGSLETTFYDVVE